MCSETFNIGTSLLQSNDSLHSCHCVSQIVRPLAKSSMVLSRVRILIKLESMKGSREENRKNFKLSDVLPRNNRKVIRFVNFCWDEKQSVSLP